MTTQFSASCVRVNEDILNRLIKTFQESVFTFAEAHELNDNYTLGIHRRFISNGILIKVRKVNNSKDKWYFTFAQDILYKFNHGSFIRS